MMQKHYDLFLACAPGLEPLLHDEVLALRPVSAVAEPGGVAVRGGLDLLHRVHLELGLALRAQLTVDRSAATRLDHLATHAATLPWHAWLPVGANVTVRAHARGSRLYHTGAIAERVAAGIAVRLGPPRAGGSEQTVYARIVDDHCALSIDTGGEPLHRRGYRQATAKAPLREDLARAALIASGWDRKTPLVDPMCGSGTIAIEGAWLARGIPPGHLRRFAFMDGPLFDPERWRLARERALDKALPAAPPILASDRDAGAIAAANANAARAGVTADLDCACAALGHAPGLRRPPSPPGAVVTNPPWGRRLGGKQPLRPLYQSLGTRLKELPGRWRVGLVLADPDFARDVVPGLKSALMTDAGGTKIYLFAGTTRR